MPEEDEGGLRDLLRRRRQDALRDELGDEEFERRYRRAKEVEGNLKETLASIRANKERIREAQLQLAITWLQRKWRDVACPYCGEKDWRVGTPLEIRLATEQSMSPAFPVMCGNCGHTTFVNSDVAGIPLDDSMDL